MAASPTSHLLLVPSTAGQTFPARGLVLSLETRPLDFLGSWLTGALMSYMLLGRDVGGGVVGGGVAHPTPRRQTLDRWMDPCLGPKQRPFAGELARLRCHITVPATSRATLKGQTERTHSAPPPCLCVWGCRSRGCQLSLLPSPRPHPVGPIC